MISNVIITGIPRSGTTALCSLINTSKECFIPDEMAWYHGYDHSVIDRFEKIVHWPANEKIWKDKRLDVQESIKHVKDNDLNGKECLAYFKEKTGSSIVGDKYPLYVSDIDQWIYRIPDVLLIVCTRNPLDVFTSQLRRYQEIQIGKFPAGTSPWAAKTYEEAENFTLAYFNKTLNLLTSKEISNTIFLVQYEKAVNDPQKLIKNLEKILNRKLIVDFSQYNATHVDSWKTDLEHHKIPTSILNLSSLLGY